MQNPNRYAAALSNVLITGGLRCEKCGSVDVSVREFQTRSSDEPVTLFVTCKLCAYVHAVL